MRTRQPSQRPAGSPETGFPGSAVSAGASGASGTVQITCTDGTTSTATPGMTGWTPGGGSGIPQFGNVTVATSPYRDAAGGTTQRISTDVFAATIPADSSKTMASITLPATVYNGTIGIFAISAG